MFGDDVLPCEVRAFWQGFVVGSVNAALLGCLVLLIRLVT